VSEAVPTAATQATALALPTTEPVLLAPDPVPTPITLSGGQGIAAPEPGSEDEDAATDDETDGDADDNDAALASDESTNDTAEESRDDDADESDADYNEAALADESEPEPTAAPQATTTPAPTSAPQAAPTAAGAAPTSAPVAQVASPQSIANGAEVYALQCARCHGAAGEGVISRPLLFIGTRYDAPSMVNELTNGHAFTFGFADELSANEISNVVNFVLSEFG